jgi:hypothetical protein
MSYAAISGAPYFKLTHYPYLRSGQAMGLATAAVLLTCRRSSSWRFLPGKLEASSAFGRTLHGRFATLPRVTLSGLFP